ncbi:hypothetical protein K7887_22525 (plasmid) [Sutcliffiella horikoshii]|uniref:hypothetical protein n=1 Tax=Sutcliffiella horikoshii TaxID=79883 RepID=UPI001CBC543B|nr:hypothetical protein [Sutcliffiella horikoshii]UAL49745.1 hypothetical protein K7887_22525 [Sutcliffiella horikoshii]
MQKVLLAIGDKPYSQIVRKALSAYSENFRVVENEIFHRDYLDEIIEHEKPNILIVHDFYLQSRKLVKEEKEQELVQIIQSLRIKYDDEIRVVYLCERERGDPLLFTLASNNVLDIFNTPTIDIKVFTEQLLDKPRYSKVARFMTDEVRSAPVTMTKEEVDMEEPIEEVSPVEDPSPSTKKPKPEKEKTIINKVVEKKVINKVVEKKVVQKQVIKKQYQLNVTQQVEKIVGVTIQPKLILVGSPYRRTGTTFFTHTLAKHISDMGVGVTYVENPYQVGYTYDRFYGHKNAKDYKSLFAKLEKEIRQEITEYEATIESQNDCYEWKHEGVNIIATNPMKEDVYPEEKLDLTHFMKLLLSLHKTPYVVVDVGTDWHREVYRELYSIADYVFLLFEPDIPLIERFEMSDEHSLKKIREMMKEEKTKIIGNKMSENVAKEILDGAAYLIPNVPSEEIFQMQFVGTFLPSTKEYNKLVSQAFNPIVEDLLPAEFIKKKKKEGSLFRSLFKNKNVELKEV